MDRKKIVVLGTGGTIAGVAGDSSDNLGYVAAQISVEYLLQTIPGLTRLPYALVCEQVAQIDSKDMSFEVWRQLAQRCAHWLERDDVQGVVITHGSDTLEETAYFLHVVLNPDKPVVLTCAMRPATSLNADGPQNLLDALTVASQSGAQGVVAVCAGVIHGAMDVQKVHPYRMDAFSSGDAGPLGYVEEGTVRLMKNWPGGFINQADLAMRKIAAAEDWPQVEILMSYAGASGAMVDALLLQDVSDPTRTKRLRGLVIAGTGNGSMHQSLEAAVGRAQTAGVRVVRSTRCCNGQVLPKPGDGQVVAVKLPPVKARVALVLELL